MNKFFPDIGELGWSMYLYFHCRWLKKHTNDKIIIMTSYDRICLYEGIADEIIYVPKAFKQSFPGYQSCFGIHEGSKGRQVPSETLKKFFMKYAPEGYVIPHYFNMRCYRNKEEKFYLKNVIYKPFKPKQTFKNNAGILIFPRCRDKNAFVGARNLPESFYEELIISLCKRFPKVTVRSIGVKRGAYDINLSGSGFNYVNDVVEDISLQYLIDRCQTAIGAIGSQSAPPKITLLQGVPTFMIGHQKKRHEIKENWMKTKAGFFEIKRTGYQTINTRKCIQDIIRFFEPLIK